MLTYTVDVAPSAPTELETLARGVDALIAFTRTPDRAWCIAAEVDPTWAGVGATAPAIARLLETPGLDCVAADPAVPVAIDRSTNHPDQNSPGGTS